MATETPGEPRIPANEAFGLAELVEYGEGAVVSRTLVETDAGTITLFAFDAGQRLSEHTAPFDHSIRLMADKLEPQASNMTGVVLACGPVGR